MGGNKARLIQISGASTARPRGHVVFVHGLNGSSHSWWSARGAELHESWPGWLSRDIADLGVWVADYPASLLWWVRAPGIRLEHRAATILHLAAARELGSAPLVFVCHSLGGLVVKKALQLASASTNPAASAIAASTRGVAFLGTPHLGSDWAQLTNSQMGRLVGSDAVVDLRTDNEELAKLHAWYSEFSAQRGIRHLVAYEVKPIKLLWQQLPLICPTDTSAPNLPAATYLPVEADHIHLSKPARYDSLTMTTSKFVQQCMDLQEAETAPAAPSPPADRSADDVRRRRDLTVLLAVLPGVTASAVGQFIESLPTGYFRKRVFDYWEPFNQMTTDATFLLYDEALGARIADYRTAWEAALRCNSQCFFAGGSRDAVRLEAEVANRTSSVSQVIAELTEAAIALDQTRRDLLAYIHTSYPEVDLTSVPDPMLDSPATPPPTT